MFDELFLDIVHVIMNVNLML